MRKIPVLAIIREAYLFTLEHLGSIIGLIWLPMLISTVAGFFVKQRALTDFQAGLAANDAALMLASVLSVLFYTCASMLLTAMMFVPVAQLALGKRQGGAMAHFAFGAAEWRLFRAMIQLFLLLLLFGIVCLTAYSATMPAGTTAISQTQMGQMFLIVLGLFAVGAYVGLRFSFILPAIVVSEEKKALSRAWSLSAGNLLAILGVVAGTIAPVFILRLMLERMALGGATMSETSPADLMLLLQMARANLPVTAGIGFLVAPFLIGLGVSAGAFTYRELARTDIKA